VPFNRDARFAGEVKYTFRKSFKLANENGIVSFSQVPLRLSTYVGLFVAIVSLLMALLIHIGESSNSNSINWIYKFILVTFLYRAISLYCNSGEYIGFVLTKKSADHSILGSVIVGFTNSPTISSYYDPNVPKSAKG
jgi:dolichol-phosphate mannosyltransferase